VDVLLRFQVALHPVHLEIDNDWISLQSLCVDDLEHRMGKGAHGLYSVPTRCC
jgi:hypothetical protein